MFHRKFTKHLLLPVLMGFLISLNNNISAQENNNDTIVLNLESAKDLALEQNPTILASKLGIRSAEYQLNETRGNLLPHLNISGSYNHNIKRPVMYLDFEIPGFPSNDDQQIREKSGSQGDDYIEIGREHDFSAGINASMPLFSPAIYANIRANRVDIELADEEYRGAKVDLAFDVQQAFFNALLVKESMEVMKLSYENALENLQNTRKIHSQGLVSEYDKIRAEVETENIKPEVRELENSFEMALNTLKTITGIDETQPIKIEGNLLEISEKHIAQFEIIEPDRGFANNPNIRQMNLNEVFMERQAEAIKATALPTVNAMSNFNYQASANDFEFSDYHWANPFMAGVQVNIPLFQGFTVKNRAKQIDIAAKQIGLQREFLKDNLQLQIDNVFKRLNVAIQKSESARRNVSLAERGHEIAKTRYNTGQSNLMELKDSEIALKQARFNLIQSNYEILMAIIEYEKIVGEEF